MMKSNVELMAAYNQRMNISVYSGAATLSAEALNLDRKAYFGSIMGTLNHIFVGDVVWLKRFAGHPEPFSALAAVRAMPMPNSLSLQIHEKLDALSQARQALDDIIIQFSNELTEAALSSQLSAHNFEGQPFTKHMGSLVQHFFNHQTHHRGQVSTLLSQAGVDIGVTDLLIDIPNDI